ncbi:MAG: protein kinase [Myxococcales bacterium]|nr:protein kinase [Myxococcales bacterium]
MAKRVETKVIKSPESRRSYRLGELLGKGGFGSVWRCTTSALKGQLCLKLTRDQESWLREAYMAKLIGDHPRVVTVHEAFPVLEGGRVEYAVVIELAEHGTAADLVEREGPMPEARAVAEIGRLLGAVEELHASGALHRDITPYNVFACGPKKTLKLADFGITTHGPRKAGAAVMPSVNAETDLLVVGESSRWGAGDAGGRKILAASAKREGGRRIDWITGEWFLKLVGAS